MRNIRILPIVIVLLLGNLAVAQRLPISAATSQIRAEIEKLTALKHDADPQDTINVKAALYVEGQFKKLGVKEVKREWSQWLSIFKDSTIPTPLETIAEYVTGIIEGSDPILKNEYILVGAHYDRLGNSSDDPGSPAGLLTLANYVAKHRSLLKRSVIFVFYTGDGKGMRTVPFAKVRASVDLDAIGRSGNDNAIQVIGTNTSPQWDSILSLGRGKNNVQLTFNNDRTVQQRNPFFYQGSAATVSFSPKNIETSKGSVNIAAEAALLIYLSQLIQTLSTMPQALRATTR